MKTDIAPKTPFKKLNSSQVNLCVSLINFMVFLIVMTPDATGIPIHEWLSLAFSGALVVHLSLHWKWVIAVTREFLRKVNRSTRFHYFINVTLFIWFFVVVVSGIVESRHLLPFLGMAASEDPFWEDMHSVSGENLWFPVGLHLLLHWKWILKTTRRHLIPTSVWSRRRATLH